MRVLVLHSRYQSGPASGENRVVDDEIRLLREAGHELRSWTPSLPGDTRGLKLALAGARTIWSKQAANRVKRMLADKPADVVHVHNLFPSLSPAVLGVAAAAGARVVVTLHNYRLVCLPATLLRGGRVCEDCVGRVPWPGVLHKCYRSSSSASAALAASLTLHRALQTFRSVSLYLAVSEFVRKKYVEGGFSPNRILVKPNFAWPTRRRDGPGGYFLYLGRLSQEKGVRFLLDAWRDVGAELLIAGDGPDRAQLQHAASRHVRLLGPISPGRSAEVLRGARALIIPSTWYEGAPRAIVEAYAAGVPVIASSLGGLPESVEDAISGLLVRSGDSGALREAVIRLLDDELSHHLGEGAFRLWEERYSPERALGLLEDAYQASLGMA